MTEESKDAVTDPLSLIDNMEPLREVLRGFVAAFVADGFSDEQARCIVAAQFASVMRGDSS